MTDWSQEKCRQAAAWQKDLKRNTDRQQNDRQAADRKAAYKQEDCWTQSDRLLTGRRKQTDRLANRQQETGSRLADIPQETNRQAGD
jgi:hypothetical protein